MEKPTSRLFEKISTKAYDLAFHQLELMRSKYPHYRDDELLMYLLTCQQEAILEEEKHEIQRTTRR